MKKIVSIIIPIYNVESFLCECMDSVLRQTYSDLEIILIDDGSTDNSGEIAEHYASIDHRIKVLHQKNHGLSAARNTGIAASTGDYIFFLDSDDALHCQTIELLLSAIDRHHADMAVCGHLRAPDVRANELTRECSDAPASQVDSGRNWLLRNHDETYTIDLVTAWGNLIPRNYLDNFHFPVGRLHEDEFTTYQLLFRSQKVVYLPAPLYLYRQRPNSIISNKTTKHYMDYLDALQQRIDFFTTNSDDELLRLTLNVAVDYLIPIIIQLKHSTKSSDKETAALFYCSYRNIFRTYRNILTSHCRRLRKLKLTVWNRSMTLGILLCRLNNHAH